VSVLTTAEVIREIERRGHTLLLDGDTLVVRPPMQDAMRERVRARKLDIVAYLREQRPASAHDFVALEAADREMTREYGVCIACGIPWSLHGEPPIASWRLVEDYNDVALIDAATVVVVEIAQAAMAQK